MISRRLLLVGATSGAALVAAGCTTRPEPDLSRLPPNEHRVVTRPVAADLVVAPGPEGAVAASRALFAAATAVVVIGALEASEASGATDATPAPDETARAEAPDSPAPGATASAPVPATHLIAARVATALGVPFFLWTPDLAAELDRLQTRTVVAYAADGLDLGAREVIAGPAEATDLSLPGLPATPPAATALAFSHGELAAPTTATLAAAGLRPMELRWPHPGIDLTSTAFVRANGLPVVAVGEGFGDDQQFAAQVRATRTAPELPGGGIVPFPGRRMIALYGHPQTPLLGMMGEQSPAKAVERVRRLVAEYQPLLSGETVMGAFEIIATVASGAAGDDGDYSNETAIDVLLPWIEAAEAADVYVVLDMQPGRTDFVTQAKRYEELLRRPHVGLALDPEWRLRPDGRHLVSIGQVGVDEVNEVGAWLADLVQTHDLPPKVLILHQFQTRMITERHRLDTTRPEVQHLVHVDGQGSQGAKQATWAAITRDLPERTWLGWKNFEDEDQPMLTPAQTVAQVHPTPDFISYQ
ncbi:MAG: hypothetical protein IPL36_02485 [Nigerium sp.]|nr:hypothetical protein [Nigerium sp.]